jgi:hypothetical protein
MYRRALLVALALSVAGSAGLAAGRGHGHSIDESSRERCASIGPRQELRTSALRRGTTADPCRRWCSAVASRHGR